MRPKNTFDDAWVSARTTRDTETGCLVWNGSTVNGGYGKTSMDGRSVLAHKAIWEARHGKIPKGMVLCHSCDNTACVNHEHLWLGTNACNSKDMRIKGRQARGTRVPKAKLTDEKVKMIKNASYLKCSQEDVARKFGISQAAVSRVLSGKTWRHVK